MSLRRLSSRRANRQDRRRSLLRGGLSPRVLQAEQLESRMLLAGDLNFHNAFYPQDVDQSQYVSPRDLLVIINQLNAGGARQLLSPLEQAEGADGAQGEAASSYKYDVNNDGALSASDAMRVVNYLNSQQGEHAEIMEYRIVYLQPGTNTALPSTIMKGTDFEIAVIVQDIRGPDQIGVPGDRGVLNASIDLNLNSKALARVENEEVQILRILGNPTGGTFTLTFNDGTVSKTTPAIQFNPAESRVAIATRIQTALTSTGMTNVGAGNIEVVPGDAIFGVNDNSAFIVRFQGALGDKDLPFNLTGNANNLTGGTNPSITATQLFAGTANADSFTRSLLRRYQIVGGQLVADYNTVITGTDASNPDRIDDAGGLHTGVLLGSFPDGQEADPRLLFRVRMNSLDAGTFRVEGDDQNVGENLLYVANDPDHEDKVLLPHEIKITNPAALKIIEPFSANADPFSFNEDPGTQTLNVTANDTANSTSTGLPTGTLPTNVVIVSTSAPSLGGSVSINTGGKTLSYTPAANISGTETFTYTLRNPNGVTDTATVTITLAPVNDAPVNAVPTARTVAEDGTLVFAGNLSISDVDAGGAAVQTTLTVTNGTLTLAQTSGLTFIAGGGAADSTMTFQGTIAAINSAINGLQYKPSPNSTAADTLQIITSDLVNTPAPARSDTDSVAITVTAVNDAPIVSVPAAQSAVETVATTLAAITVADVDFQPTSPSNMQVTLSVDGIGTFSLPTVSGLTFTAGDGTNDATMTFTGNLTNINAALAAISYTAGLGDAAASRTLTITANDNGSVGGGALQDQKTLTINVIPLDRPFARDDAFTVNEDSLNTTPANTLPVLTNDFKDADKTLVIVEFTQPANGTVTQVGDQLVYVPNADFFGTDTFRYTINQTPDPKAPGDLDEDQIATVTITVNNTPDNPIASADAASTNEDTAVDVAVMANDRDVDLGLTPATQIPTAATHTVVIVSQPTNGSASVNANGTVKYTPAANFSGSDSFTYRLTDANGTSQAATVSLTVNPVNDAPVAAGDAFSTDEDTTLNVSAPGVLGNDTDVDGPAITVSSVTQQPTKGSLTLNADGSFTYIPNQHANGTDTFKYRATDGSLTSNEATVTITINAVNDAPVAVDDAYSATEDTTRNVTVVAQGLIGNDTDVDNTPNQLSVSFFSQPANGSVSVSANGTFSYTPDLDFIGTDTFTYRISDGNLQSNTATVTIIVQEVNDPATAVNDSYSVSEDSTLTVSTPETGVQGNDLDPDTALALRRAVLVDGTDHGSLTLNPNGTFTYTPSANFFGSDSFTYQVDDGGPSPSNVATVSITVNAVNDNPVVANDTFTAIKHDPPAQDFTNQQINVLANDQVGDPDPGETLTIVAVSDPANGTAVIAADGKSVLYTPDTGYEGPDSFTYTVQDDGTNPSNLQSTATVNIDVVNFIPTDISGTVWTDVDNDGVIDSVERRLAGVEVRLVGSSFRNQNVDVTVKTDINGRYEFAGVEPGDYRISETTPEYMRDGKDSYNTTTKGFDTAIPIVTGSGNDFCDIHIPLLSTDNVAKVLENNNFGEIGLDSAYINLAELLASTTTNGMIIAVGAEGTQLWHSQLDGWADMKSCTLTASADFSSATLTVTDMAGNVSTKTLTQTGTTRFRVIGRDGDNGYLIRVEGTSAQHGLTLSGGQEGEDSYASDVDAIMSGIGG